MAKKKSVVDEILDGLSGSGSEIIKDVVEELFGTTASSKKGENLLEDILGNGDILDSLAETVEDLTGLGSSNTKASSTAKKTSKTKSSSSAKKTTKNSTKKSATTSKSSAPKKKTSASKSASTKKTTAAKSAVTKKTTKTKTSSTKKKITT